MGAKIRSSLCFSNLSCWANSSLIELTQSTPKKKKFISLFFFKKKNHEWWVISFFKISKIGDINFKKKFLGDFKRKIIGKDQGQKIQFLLWRESFKLSIPNVKFSISSFKFSSPNLKLSIPNFQIPSFKFQIPGFKFQIPNSKFKSQVQFQISNFKLQISNFKDKIFSKELQKFIKVFLLENMKKFKSGRNKWISHISKIVGPQSIHHLKSNLEFWLFAGNSSDQSRKALWSTSQQFRSK